ncbi:hypothetical protein NDU88_002703 [Pleurodeles waltl]|uniref:Uncharacterized protein n=1 Tax=Pleurodeles waltl TaxID=8319 RepID=A0AAV7TLY4_PLEWA|nr:hypothetical protein NDU88_002703 [Pleurodeles waltl]
MQWDYTATQQAFLKSDSACSTLVPAPTGGPAEPPSLDLIYRTMVQNHEQAQRESRKMKAANRQLQLSIKKVVKSCQDIGVRIATMETRTEELEVEVKAATAQTSTQWQQILVIQWKLEDAENRQRRNNLRILGIAEDLEGQDTRAYIASLFKKAFPALIGWDWKKEIQRAHRFPLMRKKQALTSTGRDQSYPRAIIVYFGNFLLRQAVFEKARPNSKVMVEGVSFFSRPDFAHATVERRWRLRQMIAQFQELGAEAYLLSPARLKIRAFLLTSMTQGWHIDKIKLMEVSRHPTSCGIKNLYPLLLNAIQDDLASLVKKWEGRVGAKETEVWLDEIIYDFWVSEIKQEDAGDEVEREQTKSRREESSAKEETSGRSEDNENERRQTSKDDEEGRSEESLEGEN